MPYTKLILLCEYKLQEALIQRSTWADSLAGHYSEIVTGNYFSITHATVVGCDEPGFFAKITTHKCSRTVKTTEFLEQ